MLEVNGSGEPCDREGHARFDGEALETGDDAKAEWPTCRRETGGMNSLAYGAIVPRQRLTLLKRAFQALVDRGGEAEPVGRWGLAEIERLFALWHRFRAGEFDRQELRRLRVCADISGVFLDADGKPVRTELAERMIGINYEQMRAIPELIAIPYGLAKAPAVSAALRSGLIGGLVTHTALAQLVLDDG